MKLSAMKMKKMLFCAHSNTNTDDADSSPLPLFNVNRSMVKQTDLDKLKVFARQNLGEDNTSDFFIKREKSIAFVYVVNNQVFRLDQDYFIQHESYNDFSGGYKRTYKLIPKDIVINLLSEIIIQFKNRFDIPDETIFLVNFQSSTIDPDPNDETSLASTEIVRRSSITGQGIHTDGLCDAMICCIERSNVEGAENLFFKDLEGDEQLGDNIVLQEGDTVFFQDDKIFHYVTPSMATDTSLPMRRTMLLIHSPADHLMTGLVSRRNSGRGTNYGPLKLREIEKLQH